jgi:predicted TIM-barrel fold metal-dependent hydrolase
MKQLVFDSDFHIVEPPDMFARYLDKRFQGHIVRSSEKAYSAVLPFFRIDNHVMPDFKNFPASLGPDARENLLESSERVALVERKTSVKYKSFFEQGWSGKAFLRAMDAEDVDLTVLYPTSALLAQGADGTDPLLADAIARAYNNYLYDLCNADPARLYGAAMVSVHSIELAVAEARRAVEQLGFKAIFLRPNLVGGRLWYDAYYEPLWSLAEELNVPICFHEGIGASLPHAGDIFGANIFLHHVACHPMEMMLALMQFCGGGVLERHPTLRVAFLEGNVGWSPWLLDRLDDHYGMEFGVNAATLPHAPSYYFKRQCYLSVECDEGLVGAVVEALGNRNFIFSTDFPHPDSKYPRAVETFRGMPGVSDETKTRILGENCFRLYGMEAMSLVKPRRPETADSSVSVL